MQKNIFYYLSMSLALYLTLIPESSMSQSNDLVVDTVSVKSAGQDEDNNSDAAFSTQRLKSNSPALDNSIWNKQEKEKNQAIEKIKTEMEAKINKLESSLKEKDKLVLDIKNQLEAKSKEVTKLMAENQALLQRVQQAQQIQQGPTGPTNNTTGADSNNTNKQEQQQGQFAPNQISGENNPNPNPNPNPNSTEAGPNSTPISSGIQSSNPTTEEEKKYEEERIKYLKKYGQ